MEEKVQHCLEEDKKENRNIELLRNLRYQIRNQKWQLISGGWP
jgi:hypothetical protein